MTNEALVAELIRLHTLKTPIVIEAFLSVDRKDFVPEQYAEHAYDNTALPLASGSTISQPTTVAIMMELLNIGINQKILDIGSGSGWTAALLSELAGPKGKIYGTEILSDVLQFGRANLNKYHYRNINLSSAEDLLGLPSEAPFDRILVSAASEEVPKELTGQLKIGGILVMPIQHSLFKIIRTDEDKVEATEYPGFSFVPLR